MSELALKLIEENKRKHAGGEDATFLDLGNCGLTDELPEELFDCYWLEGLNLGEEYFETEHNEYIESKNEGNLNQLGSFAITPLKRLKNIKALFLSSNQISDLSPLSAIGSLNTLDLRSNQISDLSPLSAIGALNTLDLRSNQISDLSPLSAIGSLNTLDLRSNQISDLSPLSAIGALNTLYLSENQISDLSPLSAIGALNTLYLSENQISDLSPLSAIGALNTLYLSENQISDLSPLSAIGALNTLYLSSNQISDLSPLSAIGSLNTLDLRSNQISDLSPLSAIGSLNTLDLSENQISDLSPLSAIGALNTLDLRSNQISDLSPLSAIGALNTLYLSSNQISDLSPLSAIGALNTLYLSENQISDLSPLSAIGALNTLDLRSNQISDLSPLSAIGSLNTLDLSSNQISDLSPLSAIGSLNTLYLRSNQISDLSPLSAIGALNTLYLSENQISDLSPLSAIGALNTLYLSENQISDLSPLSAIGALNTLDLSENQISDLSPLSAIGALNTLYLSENQISDLSPLSAIGALNTLDLSENQISDLSPLSAIGALNTLDLSSNQISDLSPLSAIGALNTLYLSENQISDLSPLSAIGSLNTLDLRSNQISDIENLKKLAALPWLTQVNFSANAVNDLLPPEVVGAGWEAVKFRLLDTDTPEQFTEVKVLLLGNTNVGKSNLLKYLETGKPPGINTSTHGIQYKRLKNLFKNVTLHCWDFGGQEYFHATHKLFFSPGALHIVMWSKSEVPRGPVTEECYDLSYWLRCIEQLIPFEYRKDIEVLVAENKIDLNDNLPTMVNQTELAEKFKNIRFHFTNFNLKPLKRLPGFKDLIADRIDVLLAGQTHPRAYKEYLKKIDLSGKSTLLITEIDKANPEQAATAMSVFHNMGIILYFRDIINDKVFVKPEALLNLLYEKILGRKKNQEISDKEIEKSIINNDLNLSKYEIIKLLKYFKLIFQIHEKSDAYFIPQYLKPAPALIDYLERYQFQPANIRIESDHFLMSSAMASVFSAYGQHVKGKETGEYLFWKDGIIIEKNGALLMVKFNRAEQYIELFPDVQHKNFDLQNEVVGFIMEEETDENVVLSHKPVTDEYFTLSGKPKGAMGWNNSKFSIWISNDGKFFSRWDKLIENRQNEILQIEALANSKSDKNTDGKIESRYVSIFEYNHYLPVNTRGQMKKIFISYSKKDLALVNEFIDHLSALKLDGKVAHWYCTELMAGTDWNKKIQENFDNADIVCFMISPNFMNTPYIHEFEIKKAFERIDRDSHFKIVPIILDFCRWKTENRDLTRFTALPYTAKPVMDFKNKNKAWYIIQECLRLLIDNANPPEGNDFYLQSALPRDVSDIYKKIIAGKEDVSKGFVYFRANLFWVHGLYLHLSDFFE